MVAQGLRCFVIEPTGKGIRFLRRYTTGECPAAPLRGFHNASVEIGRIQIERDEKGYIKSPPPKKFTNSRKWPKQCDCGYVFKRTDNRQVNDEQIYVDIDGKEYTLRNPVPGMMYDSWWMPDRYKGADGRCLTVICPDGKLWQVDARARNCTMPDDNVHRCWVRHGEWPDVTVDKNGVTCQAGGGSIDTGTWHGFLRNGYFVT